MAGKKVTPTKAESLLIWRRRRKFKQVEAAAEFGVSVDIYREWEAARRLHDLPRQHLGHLHPHEVCLLMRRREEWTQRQLADAIGCTRLWVIQMENGDAPAERLREYWGV